MADPNKTRPTGTSSWGYEATIGDYGGALDKIDSELEGDVPIAWSWYLEIEGMLGDAFTRQRTGLVHARKLALARLFSAVARNTEKMVNNSRPRTARELLFLWADFLRVPIRATDQPEDVRRRCAAHFRAAVGPTRATVDDSLEELLGNAFVRTWRTEGSDLATPPTPTFWPGVNPGPSSHDIGNGTWLSARSHLVVEVQQAAGMTEARFLYLMNVELFQLLDRMLPAYTTFNWGLEISSGFRLDVSRMDYGAFNP